MVEPGSAQAAAPALSWLGVDLRWLYADLLHAVLRRTRCHHRAGDVLHDALLRYAHAAARQAVQQPHAYLRRVVDSVLVDHARAECRWRPLPDDDAEPANGPAGLAQPLAPPTELLAEMRQRLQQLQTLMHGLPPRCREVFWLCRVEGHSQPAVAQRLGLALKTVEGHLARALVELNRLQRLPDGSRVTLAGATRLALRWSGRQRHVQLLQGMAGFEVAADPTRPFVVDSGLAQISVLGTQFGVNRLPDRVRVSVLEGRAQVVRQQARLWGLWLAQGQTWQLGQGEVLEVQADQEQRLQRSAADELAWLRGHLVLADADLQEVAAALSRYSSRPVQVVPSARLAAVRLAAVVQTHDVAGFLRALPGIATHPAR